MLIYDAVIGVMATRYHWVDMAIISQGLDVQAIPEIEIETRILRQGISNRIDLAGVLRNEGKL